MKILDKMASLQNYFIEWPKKGKQCTLFLFVRMVCDVCDCNLSRLSTKCWESWENNSISRQQRDLLSKHFFVFGAIIKKKFVNEVKWSGNTQNSIIFHSQPSKTRKSKLEGNGETSNPTFIIPWVIYLRGEWQTDCVRNFQSFCVCKLNSTVKRQRHYRKPPPTRFHLNPNFINQNRWAYDVASHHHEHFSLLRLFT